MSKLFELLTEVAKRNYQCELTIWETGRMVIDPNIKGEQIHFSSDDESKLIAKLSEYLAKEKNQ